MNLPEHHPHAAKFTVHDMHSHAYASTPEECREWAERLKANNIDKVVVNTYASGEKFDELYEVYKNASDRRNLVIRVTDPALIEKTGGIVQGMSGSPILQDGKLIGAVTHVMVNDPTMGYGICIESMLGVAAEQAA